MSNRNCSKRALVGGIWLTLLVAVCGHGAYAQGSDPETTSAPATAPVATTAQEQAPINGFAETWRSAASAKRGKVSGNKVSDLSRIREIEMFVGETRIFPAPKVARIAVGNGQLMSAASLDDKEVIVFANAVGTSSLFIWNRDGGYSRIKVNIVPGDTSRFSREIAAFLSSIPKARASVIGDKVVVEGDDLDDQDLNKIEMLSKRYPQIVNFTNPVGWDQMVLMDVKVVEFPKKELRDLGLKWGATGGMAIGGVWSPITHGKSTGDYQINLITGSENAAPIVSAGSSGSGSLPLHSGLNVLSVLNMGLNAQLNLLAEDGKAAILASPQLSARNGATAEFLAGGELPYAATSANGSTTVLFKKYGVKLNITPKVGKNGVIRAMIDSEVSSVDPSISTAYGPALLSRNTKTEFNVRSGDTLVLAGLITRKNSTDITKVPLLGDIPVVGALFRSKRFQNDETELVVFVTPTVVDSRSPGLVDRVEKAKQRLEERMGSQPYVSDPLQPGRDLAQPGQPVALVAPPEPLPPPAPPPPASVTNPDLELLGGVLDPPPAAADVESDSPQTVAIAMPADSSEGQTKRDDQDVRSPRSASPETAVSAMQAVTARPSGGVVDGRKYRVTGKQLALRVSPDINAYVVDRMPKDAIVESLSERRSGSWVAIQYQQQWGWAAMEYLDSVEGTP